MTTPFYDEYTRLSEAIRQAKGDLKATSSLIEKFDLRTLDGVPIRLGLEVTDYDIRRTTIIGIQSAAYSPDGKHVIWFETTTGMFDAGRLWARQF